MSKTRLQDITIQQFYDAPKQEYHTYLDMLAPASRFNDFETNVKMLPWLSVKTCIRLLSKDMELADMCRLFCICFNIENTADFYSAPITDYYMVKRYLTIEFENIIKQEAAVLTGPSTDLEIWKMAGSDRLNIFSDTLPLIQLGKAFGQYPYDIGKKPYSEVLGLLVQLKTQGEVESEYQKLMTKK